MSSQEQKLSTAISAVEYWCGELADHESTVWEPFRAPNNLDMLVGMTDVLAVDAESPAQVRMRHLRITQWVGRDAMFGSVVGVFGLHDLDSGFRVAWPADDDSLEAIDLDVGYEEASSDIDELCRLASCLSYNVPVNDDALERLRPPSPLEKLANRYVEYVDWRGSFGI